METKSSGVDRKQPDPEHKPEHPVSCGSVCGAARENCAHTCQHKCHPGKACPPGACPVKIIVKCKCGRLSVNSRCGAVEPLQPAVPLEPDSSEIKEAKPRSRGLRQLPPTRTLACDDDCEVHQRNARFRAAFDLGDSPQPFARKTANIGYPVALLEKLAVDELIQAVQHAEDFMQVNTSLTSSASRTTSCRPVC